MSFATTLNDLEWEAVRPTLATGVSGKTLLDAGTKVVYTSVEPAGGFPEHVDRYGHLLFILKGTGIAGAGGREYPLEAGVVLRIEAGERHFYRNTGAEPLEMISLNLP